MDFFTICTSDNLAWRSYYYDAFFYTSEKGEKKTIFRYDIPFPKEDEAIRFEQYGIPSDKRLWYYDHLARCIKRQYDISCLLNRNAVPSILTYHSSSTSQRDENTDINHLYFVSHEVRPIMDTLFKDRINLLTLLDVFIRLSVIIRDISKPPCCLSHRGISMDEIYLTPDNKILLGGFYYAATAYQGDGLLVGDFDKPLPYLPEQGMYFPPSLIAGGPGSAATDMQTISRIMFNFCSGLPWDTQWPSVPNIAPSYIPEELIQVLIFGMNCTDADCNAFRRKLLDCRKALSKTEAAQISIPIRKPLLKQFAYE